jgi:hypothetical protein
MDIVGPNGAPVAEGELTVRVTFQGKGAVRVETPPGLDYGQLVIAAALIARRADALLDAADAMARASAEEAAAVVADLARERRRRQ